MASGPDIQALKAQLYEACWEDDPQAIVRQEDLLAYNIIPKNDVQTLLAIINQLTNEKLFKPISADGSVGWRLRAAADAVKYKGLTAEQILVYELVDEAGAEGIWSKTIKTRSALHDSTMRQVLKALETKRLISDMKSVQHPTRKMYIKTSIQPSDAATGGAWFTDGELDESFIDAICEALYNYIFSKSFYQSSMGRSKQPSKTRKLDKNAKKSTAELKAMRDAALEPQVKLEDAPDERSEKQTRLDSLLPLPPGYQGYPTLTELTRFVDTAKITETALAEVEIQQLIDVLIWDNKIEAVVAGSAGLSYRALRKTAVEMEDGPSNGLTEAPCGKCPVFDLCEEGGPVAPSNCEYFKRWLDPEGY